MNCGVCNRQLKTAKAIKQGMGDICLHKAKFGLTAKVSKPRVVCITPQHVTNRKTYLVFADGIKTMVNVFIHSANDKTADCQCNQVNCNHIQAVREVLNGN